MQQRKFFFLFRREAKPNISGHSSCPGIGGSGLIQSVTMPPQISPNNELVKSQKLQVLLRYIFYQRRRFAIFLAQNLVLMRFSPLSIDADVSQLILPTVDANNFVTPTTGSLRCATLSLQRHNFKLHIPNLLVCRTISRHAQKVTCGVHTNLQRLLRFGDAAADLLIAEVRANFSEGSSRVRIPSTECVELSLKACFGAQLDEKPRDVVR